MPQFDQAFWQEHWQEHSAAAHRHDAPNPYLVALTGDLSPGTALDAGCGTGAEARWLAGQGWEVTGVDISAEALVLARRGESDRPTARPVTWVQAGLTTWTPDPAPDLVTTHYAHPAMPQLAFYRRLAGWVAPGGTLLVVGHQHGHPTGDAGHDHPEQATVTAAAVAALLPPNDWHVDVAEELSRPAPVGSAHHGLRDVVVRARRRR